MEEFVESVVQHLLKMAGMVFLVKILAHSSKRLATPDIDASTPRPAMEEKEEVRTCIVVLLKYEIRFMTNLNKFFLIAFP